MAGLECEWEKVRYEEGTSGSPSREAERRLRIEATCRKGQASNAPIIAPRRSSQKGAGETSAVFPQKTISVTGVVAEWSNAQD